jgi:hypothetical protein
MEDEKGNFELVILAMPRACQLQGRSLPLAKGFQPNS